MANTELNISMIANETLVILENQLAFTKLVNREYDGEFGKKGGKIGDTYNLRKPTRSVAGTTPTFTPSNFIETSVPVVIDKQYNTGLTFTSKELSLNIDDFSNRVLAPQIATISNKIDYDGMQLYKDIYQCVGTPGATPSTNLTYLTAGVKLNNSAAPNDGRRKVVINPIAEATIVNTNLTLFNPQKNIGDQYEDGNIGRALGYAWSMDQNVGVQTTGTFAALASGAGTAVTVTTGFSTGSTVVTGGWTSGDLLNIGDIFTIAGVYQVNPQNRQSVGQLQQFVVTATPTAASGGGAMTIDFSPAVVFSGDFQNVTSTTGAAAATSVVTIYAASATVSPQNLLFHPDAFTFVTATLDNPDGAGAMSYVARSKKLNMGLRIVRFYDGYNDRSNWRLDILGGWKTIRPELACRIAG